MNLKLSLLFISVLTLLACRKESLNCDLECDTENQLIFQSGFNNTAVETVSDTRVKLTGTDLAFDTLSNWNELGNHPNIGHYQINYEDGNDDQRFADIISDPMDETNKVLRFKINEPHIYKGNKAIKGRVQMGIINANCIKEYYQTVRLYLHPDMAHLKDWDKRVHWLSLFEFWNNGNWTGEKYPFRVTVNLAKLDEGPVDNLYFQVKGDHQNRLGNWKDDWKIAAEDFNVPFGQWMELELYIKEGDEENGRFYMAVTPEGGTKDVLFDLTNNTQHSKEKCPDGFSHFHPLKFYTSDALINYMKDDNKNLEIYWDDWKIYRNKTP